MKVIVFLAIASALASTKVCGDIVAYSNLGPNDEFSLSLPFVLGNFGQGAPDAQIAFQFTSEASGFVSSVDVATGLSQHADGDAFEIVLWTDAGIEPGVEIWSGTTNPRFVSEVRSATSSETVELVAGQTYWVSGRSLNATGRYIWYRNSTGAIGRVNSDFDGSETWGFPGTNAVQTAFRVNLGQPIPEPIGGGLAFATVTGTILMLGNRRKRSKPTSIDRRTQAARLQ